MLIGAVTRRLASGSTAPVPTSRISPVCDRSLAIMDVDSSDGYFTLVDAAYQDLLG
jgi:hypothetical protein